ncbi:MAG: serine/threonine-protein kinase [Solirubrobacterales bacterium]
MAPSPIPYRLGAQIGLGAYAEVFKATSRDSPANFVAFKRARPNQALASARLQREIDVQLTLDHPNVMPVLDADTNRAWFVMPLADGSLKKLLDEGTLGADTSTVTLDIIDQVSKGLEYAHHAGYLHRDISPGNILGYKQGNGSRVWVIGDWGTVRRPLGETTTPLTDPGEGLGTAGFAAPETYDVDAHLVDERADVYSLGRVAAWLLTGRWPAPNIPLRPEGPLRGFVEECTSLDPSRRPATMSELRSRLEELTSEPPTSDRGQVQSLLETAGADAVSAAAAMDLALRHAEDGEIWIDEIARMSLNAVRQWTRQTPEAAAVAAQTMLRHTDFQTWGHRDFNYANSPLRWVHEVLRVLTEDGHLGLAEDLASIAFEREEAWDRWAQKRITVDWLRSLEEPEGVAIRRAIRRSGTRDYYASPLQTGRILSHTLAAEFGR